MTINLYIFTSYWSENRLEIKHCIWILSLRVLHITIWIQKRNLWFFLTVSLTFYNLHWNICYNNLKLTLPQSAIKFKKKILLKTLINVVAILGERIYFWCRLTVLQPLTYWGKACPTLFKYFWRSIEKKGMIKGDDFVKEFRYKAARNALRTVYHCTG